MARPQSKLGRTRRNLARIPPILGALSNAAYILLSRSGFQGRVRIDKVPKQRQHLMHRGPLAPSLPRRQAPHRARGLRICAVPPPPPGSSNEDARRREEWQTLRISPAFIAANYFFFCALCLVRVALSSRRPAPSVGGTTGPDGTLGAVFVVPKCGLPMSSCGAAFGLHPHRLCRVWAKFGRFRPKTPQLPRNLGQIRPTPVQLWPSFSQSGSILAEVGPGSTTSGSVLANLCPHSTTLGRIRLCLVYSAVVAAQPWVRLLRRAGG